MNPDDVFPGKLPFLPLIELTRHLPLSKIIPFAAESDRWRSALEVSTSRGNLSEMHVNICANLISYSFEEPETPGSPLEVFYEWSPEFEHEQMKVETIGNRVLHTAKHFSAMETTCLNMMHTIGIVRTADYKLIDVDLDGATIGDDVYGAPIRFATHFLSKLPRGKAEDVHIRFDKRHTANREQLMTFMHRVEVIREARIHGWIQDELAAVGGNGQLSLHSKSLSLDDARFLTRNTLETLNCRRAEIGKNNLNSSDFHAFLTHWKQRTECSVRKLEFEIRGDQEIDMEEVIRGLDAEPYDRNRRDRWALEFLAVPDPRREYPTATDYRDGRDVVNAKGVLGTVLLKDGVLTFWVWVNPFPVRSYEARLTEEIQTARETFITVVVDGVPIVGNLASLLGMEGRFENYARSLRLIQTLWQS